jgi:hypothetical protein
MTAPTTPAAPVLTAAEVERLSLGLVAFLETNALPPGLFAPDVFCDLTLPTWRIQAATPADLLRIRLDSHPDLGRVSRWRSEATRTGFVFEFEEQWMDAAGESWLSRELLWATVEQGQIQALSVYCTGDWDTARQAEHARAVTLRRP